MKKLFFIFSSLLLLTAFIVSLSACASTPSDSQLPEITPDITHEITPEPAPVFPDTEETEWTIALYMCGSDLESINSYGTIELVNMLIIDIPDDINILVMTGGSTEWDPQELAEDATLQGHIAPGAYIKPDANQTQIFRVAGNKMELLHEYGENLNMGDPQTLTGFLRYVSDNYSSRKFMSIIWNHGMGPINGIAYDELADDALSLADLAEAFGTITALLGKSIDLVGFDACSTSNLETAKIMSPYADYMVASSDFQLYNWAYDKWLETLSRNTAMEAPELGRAIVDAYVYKFNPDGDWSKMIGSHTLALIDLCEDKMEIMLDAFNAMATELHERLHPEEFPYAFATAELAQKTAHPELIDLYDFATVLNNFGVFSSAGDVISALGTPPGYTPEHFIGNVSGDGIVLYRGVGNQHHRSIGLSFWLPATLRLPHHTQEEIIDEFKVYPSFGMGAPYTGFLEDMLQYRFEQRPFTGNLDNLEMSDIGTFYLHYNDPFAIDNFSYISTQTSGGKTFLLNNKKVEYNWLEGRYDATTFEGTQVAMNGRICTADITFYGRNPLPVAIYSAAIPAYINGDYDNIAEVSIMFSYTSDSLLTDYYPARGFISSIVVSGDSGAAFYSPDTLRGLSVETLLLEVNPVTNEPTGRYTLNEPFTIDNPGEFSKPSPHFSLEPLPRGQNITYNYYFELTDKKGSVFTASR